MNPSYGDIVRRIAQPPLWWDEHAVPRYDPFDPLLLANIYAEEAALVAISCQACDREFLVAFSWSRLDDLLRDIPPISIRIDENALSFGDPPNAHCCPAGPTMSSLTRRVVAFWRHPALLGLWQRDPTFERSFETGRHGDWLMTSAVEADEPGRDG